MFLPAGKAKSPDFTTSANREIPPATRQACTPRDGARCGGTLPARSSAQPILENLLVVGVEFVEWVLHRHYGSP
jgi:hypothetical protein